MVVEPLVGRLGLPVRLTGTNCVSGGRVGAQGKCTDQRLGSTTGTYQIRCGGCGCVFLLIFFSPSSKPQPKGIVDSK